MKKRPYTSDLVFILSAVAHKRQCMEHKLLIKTTDRAYIYWCVYKYFVAVQLFPFHIHQFTNSHTHTHSYVHGKACTNQHIYILIFWIIFMQPTSMIYVVNHFFYGRITTTTTIRKIRLKRRRKSEIKSISTPTSLWIKCMRKAKEWKMAGKESSK